MVIIKVSKKEYQRIINKEVNGLIVASAPDSDAFNVFIYVNNQVKAKCICTQVFPFKNTMDLKEIGVNESMACYLSNNTMLNINKQTDKSSLYCWKIKDVEEYKEGARIPDSYSYLYSSIF